jgi:hypothetical protein
MKTSADATVNAKLEISKQRLAAAFNRLERAIDIRIRKEAGGENQNNELTDELLHTTEGLMNNLRDMTANYNHLKTASTDVLSQLNTSITTLETLLKNKQIK